MFLYSPVPKLTISVQTFQYLSLVIKYEKNCEKHVKKDPYNGSIVRSRNILLTFKGRILLLLIYIRLLEFTINT